MMMNPTTAVRLPLPILLLAAIAASPAAAQDTQTATPSIGNYSLPGTPTAVQTPVPIPPAPIIVLPAASPTPSPTAASTPTATAIPQLSPTPRASAAAPTPHESPAPQASQVELSPASLPTSAPSSTPAPAPVAPSPTISPTPEAAAIATPQPDMAEAEAGSGWLWWLAGVALLAIVAAAAVLLRRRADSPVKRIEAPRQPAPVAPLPVATRTETPDPAPAETARDSPVIDLSLAPTRAGLNLLSAVVEGELTVTNIGTVAVERVRIVATLVSAHGGQDADLTTAIAQPVGRALAPPFNLAPGESRQMRLVAALARDGIRAMSAGDRPIFVPIVALSTTFSSAGTNYRAARAFAVGVERVDSAKLAPIWLDVPPRMYDGVAARPHALPAGLIA